MRQWPRDIHVELRSTDGSPVDGLLLGLAVRHRERSYYHTLLGVSGPDGVLRIDGATLAAHYAEDQRLSLMDYRLPLADWDKHAVVSLAGGRDFDERRQAALESPLLLASARALWSAARNTGVAVAAALVALDGCSTTVVLPVRRIGLP